MRPCRSPPLRRNALHRPSHPPRLALLLADLGRRQSSTVTGFCQATLQFLVIAFQFLGPPISGGHPSATQSGKVRISRHCCGLAVAFRSHLSNTRPVIPVGTERGRLTAPRCADFKEHCHGHTTTPCNFGAAFPNERYGDSVRPDIAAGPFHIDLAAVAIGAICPVSLLAAEKQGHVPAPVQRTVGQSPNACARSFRRLLHNAAFSPDVREHHRPC